MEKIYYFQPHIRYSEKPAMRFFAILIAASLALPFISNASGRASLHAAIRLSAYLTLTLLCTALLARMICRRWRYARFVLGDEQLMMQGLFASKIVSFKRITHVWHFHFLYWFGIAAVREGKTTIYLPFVVDNLSQLLLDLCERLQALGKQQVCLSPRFKKFIHAARVNDVVNNRIYHDIGLLTKVTVSNAILSAFVACAFWRMYPPLVYAWTIFGLALPLAAYLAANIIISFDVSLRLKEDFSFSHPVAVSAIYAYAGFIAAIVYLCAGILYQLEFYPFLYWY